MSKNLENTEKNIKKRIKCAYHSTNLRLRISVEDTLTQSIKKKTTEKRDLILKENVSL